jgi:hypothetical protein
MKPLIFLFFISFFIFSCSPAKRMHRLVTKHPDLIETKIDTIIKDSIVYEDRIVEKIIPADTVYGDTVYLPIGVQSIQDIYAIARAENDLSVAIAELKEGKLTATVITKLSRLEFKLDSAIVKHHKLTTINKTVYVTVEVPPKWAKFYRRGFFILIGLIMVVIVVLIVARK